MRVRRCLSACQCVCAYIHACVCACVCVYIRARVTMHMCRPYSCCADMGAHAGELVGAGSRTCGCTCVRARVCMYDYYIILLYV